ncbi:peptidoglycan-associated lipoprotein Pal [Aliikangiella sp. G2MR2-5]|uniref:peptidoglycan-associated lipoprotein Pal n=1 Tax=Aliikangiella sp. G2MR2-5 TaxID=2788943 RepID=UPI0018AC8833|nr:peptidoglycan-associated lipoprotein Pal [Aliikangiella sp. G2MR2-5]
MSITKLGKVLVVLASASFLFACSSDGSNETDTQAVVQEPVQEVVEPVETEEERMTRINAETRQARTVYFDLDDDTVKPEGRALLEAHAWFLAKNANTIITIEGHCDERGTPAYNLALGERRAKAVAEILMLNGVAASQIKTVSHGEEKPAAMGHDESAWSMNRRGELKYEG